MTQSGPAEALRRLAVLRRVSLHTRSYIPPVTHARIRELVSIGLSIILPTMVSAIHLASLVNGLPT